MIKHTPLSFIKDARSLNDLIQDKEIKNEEISLPEEEIVPVTVTAAVSRNEGAQFGRFITLMRTDSNDFPSFSPGQFLIVRSGIVGVRASRAYYIVSRENGAYTVFVPASDDNDISVFAGAGAASEFSVIAPCGTCIYNRIRDGRNLFVLSDKEGFGAVQSFRKNSGLPAFTKTYTFFGRKPESDDENPQLNVFIREARSSGGSLFIYGSGEFVNAIRTKAEAYGLPGRNIKYDIISPAERLRYGDRKYICHIKRGSMVRDIVCSSDIPLAQSFELAGIESHVRCMSGECGYCRCRLIKGQVVTHYPDKAEHLTQEEKESGYIHPCRCYPKSEITVAF